VGREDAVATVDLVPDVGDVRSLERGRLQHPSRGSGVASRQRRECRILEDRCPQRSLVRAQDAGERLFTAPLTIEPISTTAFSGEAVAHVFATQP
jgi:hypothetical protein